MAAEREEMAIGQLLEIFGDCCRVSEAGGTGVSVIKTPWIRFGNAR